MMDKSVNFRQYSSFTIVRFKLTVHEKVGKQMGFNEEIYQNYQLDLAPQRVVIKNAMDWEERCNALSDYLDSNVDKLSSKEYQDLRTIADQLLNVKPELIQIDK